MSLTNNYYKEIILTRANLTFSQNQNIDLIIKQNEEVNLIIETDTKVEIYLNENNVESEQVEFNIEVFPQANLILNVVGIGKKNKSFKFNIKAQKNANVEFNNLAIANNNQKKYEINMINQEEKSNCNIFQKGVSKNLGYLQFIANGKILPNCPKSTNFQESRILLLDESAYAEVTPVLLIETNDVLAGHKGTVSKVDEEQLYYLQTRMVSKEKSSQLLIGAFLVPLLDKIQGSYQEIIQEQIQSELN